MNLTVTERAQEYIAQEGNVISVRIAKRLIPSCTATKTADLPTVQLGKPADYEKADYEAVTIDGVEVYAHSSIINYNGQVPLRIDIETTLFGKQLAVYGMPIPIQSCGDCTLC
ncbi:hypothetical protein SPSIL_031020 [Sporomusa silvacetica DSM 10669]|uniref:FeS cluster biogenesis domain-containing protein n=1 Tax=Sporomusa silvacetica DSM 10669 TaxID=1123289 RepID=A0ABZ3IMX0_9FIRM|nr:CC/Se motif family (seleno)protein [Sporomusa silvacetica]OZC18108.1 hypothetical protein SPSIL_26750 [Sporomusa silvacetica DSM 10669]